jgi:hypothetical protein
MQSVLSRKGLDESSPVSAAADWDMTLNDMRVPPGTIETFGASSHIRLCDRRQPIDCLVRDGSLFLNANPVRGGGYWATFSKSLRDRIGHSSYPASREPPFANHSAGTNGNADIARNSKRGAGFLSPPSSGLVTGRYAHVFCIASICTIRAL